MGVNISGKAAEETVNRNICLWLSLALFFIGLLSGPLAWKFSAGALALAVVTAKDPRSALPSVRLRFWLFPLMFAVLAPFFAGTFDSLVFNRQYASDMLYSSLGFVFHAYVFMAIVTFAGRNYSMNEIVSFAERLGFKTFGLRIALALSGMKIIRRQTLETFRQYRLTRRTWPAVMKDFDLLASATVRNCAATAERIAILFYLRGVRI